MANAVRVLLLALVLGFAVGIAGCGGDDGDDDTGAEPQARVGEPLTLGDTTLTVTDVTPAPGFVDVHLDTGGELVEVSGGNPLTNPPNIAGEPLTVSLITRFSVEEPVDDISVEANGILIEFVGVSAGEQKGATLELDLGGTTGAVDLGLGPGGG